MVPHPTRRAVIKAGVLSLAAAAWGLPRAEAEDAAPIFRIGMLTDIHYADKEPKGTRFYRESLGKMREAVELFNREQPAFVVQLGDLIDKADSVEQELGWLDTIEAEFAKTQAPRHYVLGNHCVDTLLKSEFAGRTGARKEHFYAWDHGGVHFIVLDACFRSDGVAYGRKNSDWKDANVPPHELEWLEADLARNTLPVVIFAHQRLDGEDVHSVKNFAAVQAILRKDGRTLAVFQGHSHQNAYQQLDGIHYVTLAAMIEGSGEASNGYAFLEVMADKSLRLHGFRRQASRVLA